MEKEGQNLTHPNFNPMLAYSIWLSDSMGIQADTAKSYGAVQLSGVQHKSLALLIFLKDLFLRSTSHWFS